jgi:hypothetical protein
MTKSLFIFFMLVVSAPALAQTVSDFENLSLQPQSYYDGATQAGGTMFQSGHVLFPNYFDPTFQYWLSGWAYSNMLDTTTSGFGNMYASAAFGDVNGSGIYAIGQQDAVVNLTGAASGKVVSGCYLTNSTFAYISMRDGDAFAKKFGGPTGNDPDYFKLTIKGWYNGLLTVDSVEFFLADYRFANNAQDYLVNTWQWVNLSVLGNVDSLLFNLSSTDIGPFGINTPLFFCLDNLITADSPVGVHFPEATAFALYPNPSPQFIVSSVALQSWYVTDRLGRVVLQGSAAMAGKAISIVNLQNGHYQFIGFDGVNMHRKQFIKCN